MPGQTEDGYDNGIRQKRFFWDIDLIGLSFSYSNLEESKTIFLHPILPLWAKFAHKNSHTQMNILAG